MRQIGLLIALLFTGSNFAAAQTDERRDNSDMLRLVEPIAAKAKGSVVQVLSRRPAYPPNASGRENAAGRSDQTWTPVALGTVVAEDGYVLTKRSELSGDPIRVRLSDGRLVPARVSAVRRQNDLAMLRIEGDVTLSPVEFATNVPPTASFLVSVGRTGRPLGIGVVGVNKARPVGHQGRLGVLLQDDVDGRALVNDVVEKSGADQAGIVPGDLIVAINGREENTRRQVIDRLRGMFPGERVRLTILRSNDSKGLDTLEVDALIRDMTILRESASDTMVNGPRNTRLSGFDRVIQHDTVLDRAQCGGPLLDSLGRVVGINIARAGRVVTYALPSELLLPELLSMLEESRAASR
ncbi:MAG: S1C family serine protease [Planctomycetota bacterium]